MVDDSLFFSPCSLPVQRAGCTGSEPKPTALETGGSNQSWQGRVSSVVLKCGVATHVVVFPCRFMGYEKDDSVPKQLFQTVARVRTWQD